MSPLISGLASVASFLYNAASGSKSAATARASQPAAAEPSAVVTLSKEAEALTGFAGKGILMTSGKLDGPLGTRAGADAGTALTASQADRAVSKKDFQELLASFGATDAQKEQLAAGFDANQDGAISRDEFLKGVAATSGTKGGSELSQSLLQLVDRHGNANGVVNQTELAQLTTAFANAQLRTAA